MFIYVIRCKDNSLYTGWTDDLPKRIEAHNGGVGAKYTRGRGPVKLVYWEELGDKGAALRREMEIKSLTKKQKENLIKNGKGDEKT